MIAVEATVTNRQILVEAPADWPDGTRVELTPIPPRAERIGLDESEWRDDAAALTDWEAWLQTIEPLEFTPEEAAVNARFDEAMRRFNLDAVRRQMEEAPGA